MKMYMVGGAVRDEILGVKSKDIDFTVVLEPGDPTAAEHLNAFAPFEAMVAILKADGFEMFVETPEHLTARGRFTGKGIFIPTSEVYKKYEKYRNIGVDFVLARKEGEYTDGRRPDEVTPGTLMDDLARRDFTMNAIAKDLDGTLIDPFNGRADIDARIIRAVGNPVVRIREDALRAVRAVRFAVTKNFAIEEGLARVINSRHVATLIRENISDERIQVELSKMFRFDTIHSMWILGKYPRLTEAVFSGSVSLDATMKLKGRGK